MKSPSLLSKCEVNCVTTYSLFEVVSQAELCYYSTNDASNDKSYGKSHSWPQWIRHFKSLFHLNINLQASGVSHPISHHVQFLGTQLYPQRFNNQLYTELLIDMLQPLCHQNGLIVVSSYVHVTSTPDSGSAHNTL